MTSQRFIKLTDEDLYEAISIYLIDKQIIPGKHKIKNIVVYGDKLDPTDKNPQYNTKCEIYDTITIITNPPQTNTDS